jgi:ABC-2 type transport system permease protein
MSGGARRILAMLTRYGYLHKRSMPRTFEIFFWPVMELLVWGFVAMYIQSVSGESALRIGAAIISAMIFWDLLYRSQQGVSISFIEDIWTQNILNLLISPLRIWEWITATFIYGLIKTAIITLLLAGLALALYRFNLVENLHFYILPLVFNLLLFGWALGIMTSSLVIRWGHAAEALIWGIPFLVQPFSAIYYPLWVLPPWLAVISKALPSTYVFEGIRAVIQTGRMPFEYFLIGLALNVVYFILSGLIFNRMFRRARVTGRLGHLGMD